VDGSGNVVFCGRFDSQSITFGTTTLTTAGGSDVFVAKLTPAGIWQWATRVGGSLFDDPGGLAVDGSGNVVITGTFQSPTLTFGSTMLTNAGAFGDVFVAKLTPMGIWEWASSAGGGNSDFAGGVAMDSSGNVVMTGSFSSPMAIFGATTLINLGNRNSFVAKLTPAGSWLWATRAGESNGDADGYGVAVDGSGSVVVTGSFNTPTLTFGTATITNMGNTDIFVAKLTPAGAWQWATRAGGSGIDPGSFGVAVDGSDNVVITGSFNSPTVTFGAATLICAGGTDFFVAKLTPAGVWQWATRAGGSGDDRGSDVALDGSGNLVVTGYFISPTISFGTTTLTNPNSPFPALFIASLSPTTGLPDTPDPTKLTLTPNPARTTVELLGATGPTATLCDGLGRVVRTWPLLPTTSNLDIRAVPAGLYLLRAGSATRRLVVE
jgi:hypothetical protein